MKVSFDFDDTLDLSIVQEYAKMLIKRGVDVWIVTGRYSDKDAPGENWNRDLYSVARKLGIPRKKIIFMSMQPKFRFFAQQSDFIWHLDDNSTELTKINNHTKVKGIWVIDKTWMGTCERVLK